MLELEKNKNSLNIDQMVELRPTHLATPLDPVRILF
jgi:hypothetical protein